MPTQMPLEVELAIVDYAMARPEAGPRTIATALRAELGAGVTAVYGALKRRGLETRAKRLEELRRRSGPTEPDEVERDPLLSKKRYLKAPVPGYLVGADTALVGRLKEAGIVHLAVAIDVHSSYGTPSWLLTETPRWRPPPWSACTRILPPRGCPGLAGC